MRLRGGAGHALQDVPKKAQSIFKKETQRFLVHAYCALDGRIVRLKGGAGHTLQDVLENAHEILRKVRQRFLIHTD